MPYQRGLLFLPPCGGSDGAIAVDEGTKILEIDPRGDPSQVFGLGERPVKIAHGVLAAIRQAHP